MSIMSDKIALRDVPSPLTFGDAIRMRTLAIGSFNFCGRARRRLWSVAVRTMIWGFTRAICRRKRVGQASLKLFNQVAHSRLETSETKALDQGSARDCQPGNTLDAFVDHQHQNAPGMSGTRTNLEEALRRVHECYPKWLVDAKREAG